MDKLSTLKKLLKERRGYTCDHCDRQYDDDICDHCFAKMILKKLEENKNHQPIDKGKK